MIRLLTLLAKVISVISQLFSIGSGGTWPGEIALIIYPQILKYYLSRVQKGIIIIAGTNGKTTTSKMIQKIITDSYNGNSTKIVHNDSGANLLNGIVSAFIQQSDYIGNITVDFAILEVDESTLPLLLDYCKNKKLAIVLLNLFRDQLDRYGEVDTIATKWNNTLTEIPQGILILNADDPQIAYLGKNKKNKIVYFGLDRPEKYLSSKEHATDSTYCRNCSNKLDYKGIYFSHLGHWYCPKCGSKRPKLDNSNWPSPLPGIYNEYNTLAAVSLAQELGLEDENIKNSLNGFQPAFGRQEEIVIDEKRIKIFLSKNPAGFNASLRTVIDLKPKTLLLVLNDRIPDGRDISWIWDVDFEMIPQGVKIIVSGDRVYDLALRIKYTQKSQIPNPKSQINPKLQISEDLKEAINRALSNIEKGETLYILPTYSAMLEVRQILKGRKIL